MKTCSVCNEDRPFEAFKRDKRRAAGLSAICKSCSMGAAAAWRDVHQDHIQAYDKMRDANRNRPHKPADKERHRLSNRAWEKANPDKLRTTWRNKRAKRSSAPGTHSIEDIKRILRQQKCKCAYCRASIKAKYHVDHIVPLAKGGSNWPRNLQLLCVDCNIRKNATDPIKFGQKLGFLL